MALLPAPVHHCVLVRSTRFNSSTYSEALVYLASQFVFIPADIPEGELHTVRSIRSGSSTNAAIANVPEADRLAKRDGSLEPGLRHILIEHSHYFRSQEVTMTTTASATVTQGPLEVSGNFEPKHSTRRPLRSP